MFNIRTNVVEELDILKVQAAQDKATIYELRSCLDQEREGMTTGYFLDICSISYHIHLSLVEIYPLVIGCSN